MGATSDDGLTTTTGTATWTYNRVRLAEVVDSPALLWCENPNSLSLDTGQFLAVRCGVGSMPGWVVLFGVQDPVVGAITTTVTSDDPDTPPVTGHGDAYCDPPGATCALVAPGVGTGANAGNDQNQSANRVMVLGINLRVLANNRVPGAVFEVALIQAGIAADPATKRPAVPPVYRVTIPTEVGLVDGFSFTIHFNGATRSGGVDNLTDLATVLASLSGGQWLGAWSTNRPGKRECGLFLDHDFPPVATLTHTPSRTPSISSTAFSRLRAT